MTVEGIPASRYWLLPRERRPNLNTKHPSMSADEIRERTQQTWDRFYALPRIWARAHMIKSLRSRLAFVLISKLGLYPMTSVDERSIILTI